MIKSSVVLKVFFILNIILWLLIVLEKIDDQYIWVCVIISFITAFVSIRTSKSNDK